jgi:hypothetical protein
MIQGEVANILDYGADSTGASSSQAAFVSALATGKAVYIPKGNYKVDGNIIIPEYTTMFGEGTYTSVVQCDTSTFTGVVFNVNGRCSIKGFSVTAINAPAVRTATGIYFANSTGQYFFTGHTSATDINVSKFNVGFQVNNYFDLEFHRCQATLNYRGWELNPAYTAAQDSGYYTTVTLLKCYSDYNISEGFYATSTVNGRALHFIDSVFEFNGGANAQIEITRCFAVNFSSCYQEGTGGSPIPWLKLNDVSDCTIVGNYASGTGGLVADDSTANIVIINSFIDKLTGATTGALNQNIYAVGSQIGVTSVASTVTQRYISSTVNAVYVKDLSISNQLRIVDNITNTATLNSFQLFSKTVSVLIVANTSAAIITDAAVSGLWASDTVGVASIMNAYAPGLILTVTPSTTATANSFCVVATNTTSSNITLTSALVKVAFFRGVGMAV